MFYTRERKCRHPSLDQSLDPARALFTRHGFDPVKWHSIPTRPVRDHELLRISWKRRGRREPLVSGEDRKTIERPPYAHRSTTNFSPFHLALNIIRGTEYNLSCVDIWWLVPLNHRKTSRMRVETMMRAHQTGGEMVCCLAGREFISRKKKFNLYFGGPVFSTLISPDVFSIIRAD